jgi:hypothetical protein
MERLTLVVEDPEYFHMVQPEVEGDYCHCYHHCKRNIRNGNDKKILAMHQKKNTMIAHSSSLSTPKARITKIYGKILATIQ